MFAAIVYTRGVSVPTGWTSLAVLVTLLSSAQLLTMGLIGVYVGAVFDEVKARPLYLVREVLPPRHETVAPRSPSS